MSQIWPSLVVLTVAFFALMLSELRSAESARAPPAPKRASAVSVITKAMALLKHKHGPTRPRIPHTVASISTANASAFCPYSTRAGFRRKVLARINNDLNEGTEVRSIFLCIDLALLPSAPVKDVLVYGSPNSSQWSCPPDWEPVGPNTFQLQDFNEGAGGDYVYMCYRTSHMAIHKPTATVVSGVRFTDGACPPGTSDPIYGPDPKQRISFNQGAGGKSIYMCLERVLDPR